MNSSQQQRPGHRHIPALDGLRGLALIGVLLFHANGALQGGYLGVDLFFVLSGFLITSLLLREHGETSTIDLKAFWIRRARRLFPALLLLMPIIALYARFVARPGELDGIRADALATLGYVANWHTIFAEKSYWELFASPSPLEHTWSLAIEEQFYVVWPLIAAIALRRGSRRWLLVLTLALTAASMAAMVLAYDRAGPSRAYLGTDARASGILAGCVLAMVFSTTTTLSTRSVRALDAVGVVSLVGLAYAWLKLDGQDRFLYRGGFWLTELGALVLIACAVTGARSLVARLLALRPLTLVGKVSYGAYLYHWPIDLVLTPERVHLEGAWLHALRFGVTFAVAAISYRLLEEPIRTRGVPWSRPLVIVPAAVTVAIAAIIGGTRARPELAHAELLPDMGVKRDASAGDFRIMVVGDSTANSLGWALRGLRHPGVSVELRGQDGCSMLRDSCEGPSWIRYKEDVRPGATLVFLGGAYLYGQTFDGSWREACYPAWDKIFEETLTRRMADLTTVDGPVWAVTVPIPLGPYDKPAWRAKVDCINAAVRRSAAAVEGVKILDLAELLCPGGVCDREHDGKVIRPDGVHYDLEAARLLARRVLDQVLR